MRTKIPANKIKFPAWVPVSVAEGICSLIQPMDENERATLKRLLTDRRMQRVWAELTKHKRNRSYETTDEPFHQPADLTTSVYVDGASGRMWMEKLDLDGALVTFLFMAYHLAVHPEPIVTALNNCT